MALLLPWEGNEIFHQMAGYKAFASGYVYKNVHLEHTHIWTFNTEETILVMASIF